MLFFNFFELVNEYLIIKSIEITTNYVVCREIFKDFNNPKRWFDILLTNYF